MAARIVQACSAKAVTIKAGHRIAAAKLQLAAEYVLWFWVVTVAVAVYVAHEYIFTTGNADDTERRSRRNVTLATQELFRSAVQRRPYRRPRRSAAGSDSDLRPSQ